MRLRIFPPEEMLEATVALPMSKSMSVRAAALAAFGARYDATMAECADTEAMRRVASARGGTADAGDSAAALRFGAALLAATPGADVTLTGSDALMRRPVAPLLDMLRTLGADVELTAAGVAVRGRRLPGGALTLGPTASSQFVSALLMAAPLMENGLDLTIDWNQPSLPYIDMTLAMMRRRGIDCAREGIAIHVSPGAYSAPDAPDVEPDWSAAAFWYEIAAVTAGWVTLEGLSDDTVQGDSAVAPLFERLGVLTEFTDEGAELSATPDLYNSLDADMAGMPDTVPALVVTCCLAGIPFRLSGIEVLRYKECDRIAALCAEMAKIGCLLETGVYGTVLSWDGRRVPVHTMPVFDTYGDHRMAMALAAVAVFVPGIVVKDVEVVEKSYPAFWQQLESAGFRLADPADPIPQSDEQEA